MYFIENINISCFIVGTTLMLLDWKVLEAIDECVHNYCFWIMNFLQDKKR